MLIRQLLLDNNSNSKTFKVSNGLPKVVPGLDKNKRGGWPHRVKINDKMNDGRQETKGFTMVDQAGQTCSILVDQAR